MSARYGFVACLLVLMPVDCLAQIGGSQSADRIGAFPCIVCPGGGDVHGILPGGHGRTRVAFESFKELCVSDYSYVNNEQLVRFKLEGRLWPDDQSLAVQASSWHAVCRTMRWSSTDSIISTPKK